ncbi:MAG: zinc ribbon domain-containing protein [Nanoarchaeota archaeon]
MFSRIKCPKCSSKIKDSFDFCPHCGANARDPQREMDDFGFLGRDENNQTPIVGGGNLGITDRMIGSMINALMKSLEKQMKGMDAEVQHMPNGITISVGQQPQKQRRQKLPGATDAHIERMRGMPRVEAKSSVRRLGDKVVYELKAPGVQSVNDVFVSKLASGYEVKAIGKKKVYVTSLPVELPLRSYSVEKEGLKLEFGSQ